MIFIKLSDLETLHEKNFYFSYLYLQGLMLNSSLSLVLKVKECAKLKAI